MFEESYVWRKEFWCEEMRTPIIAWRCKDSISQVSYHLSYTWVFKLVFFCLFWVNTLNHGAMIKFGEVLQAHFILICMWDYNAWFFDFSLTLPPPIVVCVGNKSPWKRRLSWFGGVHSTTNWRILNTICKRWQWKGFALMQNGA